MKRYLLFIYYGYYPAGGWNDYRGDFDSLDEAKEEGIKLVSEQKYYHVVDTETRKFVATDDDQVTLN